MATGGTHVRVVRCPKCRRLLAELANLPVYSCGGCGALLQAKHWKNGPKSTESPDVATNELNHVTEDKEPSSLKNEAKLSPDYVADHNNAEYHEPGVTDLSDEHQYSGGSHLGSSDLVHSENVESPPFAGAEPEEEAENDISSERVVNSVVGVDGLLSESELSGMLRDMVKSSITVGSHAYDGSVSSFDGLEEDKRRTHPYKPDSLSVYGEKLIRREQFLADSMRYINPETKQNQPNKWMPESSDRKLYAMKEKEWDCEELKEPARRHHLPTNRNEVERNGVPLPPKARRAGNTTGGFSRQVHEEYTCDHSSQLEQQEEEKMKLLRVIYELQNQLDKSCNLEGKAKGRVSASAIGKEKNIPTTHNHHKVPDLNYPMHPGRSRLGSNSAQQFKLSRLANDTDSKCLNCHPRDWQRSAPLPPNLHYKTEPPVIHHVHSCCNICSSVPSNTQQYMKHDLSIQVHESKSDGQRFKDHMMKKYAKGKHHVAKRHFRPKAGGAPFVTCYHCSKLLQLPEDFLILKRKCHRLSCGSCSTVLKFSVQNRTRIIPYSSKAVEPPPSEVDECSGVMDRRSTALSSHGSNCPHTDLVSCSDKYGLSFSRSCNSKGGPVSFRPLHAIQDISDDREILYAKKEFIKKQFRNKRKDPVEAYGPSSEKSEFLSDSEVLQPRSSSPLHRLMGYSSPSVVIRGTGLPATGSRRF